MKILSMESLAYHSTNYCMQLACRKTCDMPKEISGRKTPASMPFLNRKRCVPWTRLPFCWHRNCMQKLGRLWARVSLDTHNGYMQSWLTTRYFSSCWKPEITAFLSQMAQLLPSWIVKCTCSQSCVFKARVAMSMSFLTHVFPSCL